MGIGGLLFDACRLSQLSQWRGDDDLVEEITNAYNNGIGAFVASQLLTRPVSQRLAFRELGLAIGLRAISIIFDPAKLAMKSGGGLTRRSHLQYSRSQMK